MELAVKLAWLILGLVHVPPAAVFFAPALMERVYRIAPGGPADLLLVHRGALFAGVVATAGLATIDGGARRTASLFAATSVIGYLIVYARAGSPSGALQTVARVDLFALAPLAVVLYDAWRPSS